MNQKKPTLLTRLGFLILSFIIATAIFFSVTTLGQDNGGGLSFLSSTEGVYVIENLELDLRYDKTQYEVVSLGTEPYAVVRGDKALINLLKWSGDPEFFIELSGKPPGTYREQIQYSGIHKDLEVQIYPSNLELRLMEQQTLKIIPTIEVVGKEDVDSKYIVSVPEPLQEEVMIRDIQDRLNQVGQVIGVVDVSGLTETTTLEVELKVYDREGELLEEINLIDATIEVTIPIERKVTVIEEKVVNEIAVIEEVKEEDKDEKEEPEEPKNTEEPKKEEQPNKEEPPNKEPNKEPDKETSKDPKPVDQDNKQDTPKQEGVISFNNIPPDLELNHKTSGLKWTADVKINLKDFTAGEYEMTVDDKGEKKTVKFDLVEKEPTKEPEGETADSPDITKETVEPEEGKKTNEEE